MAITQLADIAEVIEKVVSTMVTDVLQQESVAMGSVRDFSSMVREGMDRLDVPLFNQLAVQDVNDDGTAMTPSTIDPETANMSLDRHKAVTWSIPKRVGLQSKLNLVQEVLKQAPVSLAAELDDSVFAQGIVGAATTQTVAAADALAAIRGMKEQFDSDNVLKSDRFLVSSPQFTSEILAVNNVIRANEFGSTAPIQAGFLTQIYGITILESSSSSIPSDGFLGYHRQGLMMARQRNMELDREDKTLEQREDFALVHLYGTRHSVNAAASNERIYVYDPV